MKSYEETWPVAIDPPGCGCCECGRGESVPLDQATPRQIADLVCGRLGNNTGSRFETAVSVRVEAKGGCAAGRSWDLDPAENSLVTSSYLVIVQRR